MKQSALTHPQFGFFKAFGKTQAEANNKCLQKISAKLELAKIDEEDAITFYIQAENTIKKKQEEA